MTCSTYVQKIGGGTRGYFAVCRVCGGDSFLNRKRLEDAEADARAHGELQHIYPDLAARKEAS